MAAQFSLFNEFRARARKSSMLGPLLEAFWVPFGLLGASGSSPERPRGILFGQGCPRKFQDPGRRFQDPPGGSKTPRHPHGGASLHECPGGPGSCLYVDLYVYIYIYILAWTCAYPCTECRGRDEETTLKTRSLFRRLVTCSNV